MQVHLKKQRGFTLTEILATVALVTIGIAIIAVVVSRIEEEDANTPIIRQVSDYIAALEQGYHQEYDSYPAILNREGRGLTNLDQYGCLVDTVTSQSCLFNGQEEELYPDAEGLRRLSEIAQVTALAVPVTDQQGDVFDSVMYSSNGLKFRVRYPLVGDDVECGIQYAYEISSGSSEYRGVTICIYESK